MTLKDTQNDSALIEDVYTILYSKTTNDVFKYEVRWSWR